MLLAAQILLALFEGGLAGLALSLLVFFAGFNLLEASLPSLVSKTAPPQAKGTAVGVYSSVQFLGAFVGAAAGGFVSQHFGAPAVFLLCALLTLSWLLVAWPMRRRPPWACAPDPGGGARAGGCAALDNEE